MPIGTPFHERTFALCESLNYREWSGYYTVSAYETHHEHEYNAIRNAAALIDISPLFKYRVSGPDATRLVNRVITRDARRMEVGQVYYTPWCDEQGKVIDDGTVARLGEEAYRWTAADPSLRWFRQNAAGMRVEIDDVSEQVAALALQGPTSARRAARGGGRRHRRACGTFRVTTRAHRRRAGRHLAHRLHRRSGLRNLDAGRRPRSRCGTRSCGAGRPFDIKPAGMLALDVARVEAGLLLIDVDFNSSRKAMIGAQKYTPFEMGLGASWRSRRSRFVGRERAVAERARGPRRMVVGLEIDWTQVEALYERFGLAPVAPAAASRVPVPVMRDGRQIGRATTTAWSPTLKRLIALATIDAPHFATGTRLEIEVTVEGVRHFVGATVVHDAVLQSRAENDGDAAALGFAGPARGDEGPHAERHEHRRQHHHGDLREDGHRRTWPAGRSQQREQRPDAPDDRHHGGRVHRVLPD